MIQCVNRSGVRDENMDGFFPSLACKIYPHIMYGQIITMKKRLWASLSSVVWEPSMTRSLAGIFTLAASFVTDY